MHIGNFRSMTPPICLVATLLLSKLIMIPIFRVARQRDYEKERRLLKTRLVPTEEHPLRGTIMTVDLIFKFIAVAECVKSLWRG